MAKQKRAEPAWWVEARRLRATPMTVSDVCATMGRSFAAVLYALDEDNFRWRQQKAAFRLGKLRKLPPRPKSSPAPKMPPAAAKPKTKPRAAAAMPIVVAAPPVAAPPAAVAASPSNVSFAPRKLIGLALTPTETMAACRRFAAGEISRAQLTDLMRGSGRT